MFAFQASVMVQEFQRLAPELYDQLRRLMASGEPLTVENYAQLPDISIDYAIMEFTEKGVVLPSTFGWSDIGSWKSLYDFLPKDGNQNVVDGDVIYHQTRNCFLMGRNRLIAANGIQDMVVVETPDSVFVSDLENSREVKSIVSELKQQGRREYQHHPTIHYGWGTLTMLEKKGNFSVDRIVIYPKQTFENTNDQDGACILTVVDGQVVVKLDDQPRQLNRGESFSVEYPGLGLRNHNDQPATMIRVTCNHTSV